MDIKLNLTDQKFGLLTVIKEAGRNKHRKVQWECQCDCGNTKVVTGSLLKSGNTNSCGCFRRNQLIKRNTKHGHSKRGKSTATYHSWASMIQRCTNTNDQHYSSYGGRGVKVCDRWLHSFSNFLEDMGEKPKGTELDKDIKGDGTFYSAKTCCWVTSADNNRARKNTVLNKELVAYLKAEKLKGSNMAEIARRLNLKSSTVRHAANPNNKTWADVSPA